MDVTNHSVWEEMKIEMIREAYASGDVDFVRTVKKTLEDIGPDVKGQPLIPVPFSMSDLSFFEPSFIFAEELVIMIKTSYENAIECEKRKENNGITLETFFMYFAEYLPTLLGRRIYILDDMGCDLKEEMLNQFRKQKINTPKDFVLSLMEEDDSFLYPGYWPKELLDDLKYLTTTLQLQFISESIEEELYHVV